MNNVQQTVFLAIERALNEGQHAKDCAWWKIAISPMTRDELAGGAADSYVRALEMREEACTCYRLDLAAALGLMKGYPPPDAGICRVCACTEFEPCSHKMSGDSCHWTDETMTLCSVCAEALADQQVLDEFNWFSKAAVTLVQFDLPVGIDWLSVAIQRICEAGGGPYLYDALCFLEKGLVEGSAEALYMDAIGSRQEYLLGRLESAATLRGVRLPERPDDVKSEALIDPAPAKDNIVPVGPVEAARRLVERTKAS